MTLIRMLDAAVARDGDAVAIVEDTDRLSYRAWRTDVSRLAGGLSEMGLRAGDHLVAMVSNRLQMATLYWACQEVGAIYTPFNWRAAAGDIAYVLEDAEARLVVCEQRSRDAVSAAVSQCGLDRGRLIDLDGAGLPFGDAYTGPEAADDGATSLMLYTSGTTGRPKGVPRSHLAERTAAMTCIAQMHYRYGEISLGVMPLFHTMGIRALLMSTFLNGTFVCMPTFDSRTAFGLIEREKISALFLVPTMFLWYRPCSTTWCTNRRSMISTSAR
jgi:2-furoate---CoA ligase